MLSRKKSIRVAIASIIIAVSMVITPAMAAPRADDFTKDAPTNIATGITFIDDPTTVVAQQNPTYDADSTKIVEEPDNQYAIYKNGVKQSYVTDIPYWCDQSVVSGGAISVETKLCYRKTDLLGGQAQYAALATRMSVIADKPHVIFDDVNASELVKRFLATGLFQKAMDNWNILLGKNFLLLRSQLGDPAYGNVVPDYTRDYVQFESLYSQADTNMNHNYAGMSGSGGITLGIEEYFDVYYVDRDQDWETVATHEIGHTLGLDHPNVAEDDQDNRVNYNSCTPEVTDGSTPPTYKSYNLGPLMMQYQRRNVYGMLDGSLDTSVELRLVRDVISAAMNTVKTARQQPVATRQINVTVLDSQGQTSNVNTPIQSQSQSVGYCGTYVSRYGDESANCQGQQGWLETKWVPGSDFAAVDVPAMSGYEVSVDGGQTWTRSAVVISAMSVPATEKLDYDFDGINRTWSIYTDDGTGAPVTNYGLAAIPTVNVVYRPVTEASAGTDTSSVGQGSSSSSAGVAVSKPAKSGKASKKSDVLARTGADVSVVSAATFLFVIAGAVLVLRKKMA